MISVTDDVEHTFSESIVDHRLPKSLVRYTHSGDRQIVVSQRVDEATNVMKLVWIKVLSKGVCDEQGMWQKIKEKVSGVVRSLCFDEGGAILLTNVEYAQNDILRHGRYIYLQTVRAEVDVKLLGTYIWEFPVYIDDALEMGQKNLFVRGFVRRDETVKIIQQEVAKIDEGNGSKTSLTERGAVYTGNFFKLTVEVK